MVDFMFLELVIPPNRYKHCNTKVMFKDDLLAQAFTDWCLGVVFAQKLLARDTHVTSVFWSIDSHAYCDNTVKLELRCDTRLNLRKLPGGDPSSSI